MPFGYFASTPFKKGELKIKTTTAKNSPFLKGVAGFA
jgi:hypothetical protein